MDLLKKAIRKVAANNGIRSIGEVLRDFVGCPNNEIEDFSGKFDDLILAQAVRVLRGRKVSVMPEVMDANNNLIEVIKSLKEVKTDDKDLLCRRDNPGK